MSISEKILDSIANEDLEDGEIEDDEEDVSPPTAQQAPPVEPQLSPGGANKPPPPPTIDKGFSFEAKHEKYDRPKYERQRSKHEDKKKSHMTEAERSVMFLHKLERMEREKRDKYRREPGKDLMIGREC